MRDSIVIGRGGIAYRADVRIDASVDVSREHARIRRDPETGAFFIIDLSTLGTTVNGQRLPRGYDDADGTKRENGVETPLPGGRADRPGRYRVPAVRHRWPAMTWLLWFRFVILAASAGAAALLAWAAAADRE